MKKYNSIKNLLYEMYNSQRLKIISDFNSEIINKYCAEKKLNKATVIFLEKRKRNEDIFLEKLLKKSINKLTNQEIAAVKEIETIRNEIIQIY